MTDSTTELSSFFEVSEFDHETYDRYADLAYACPRTRERFEDQVREHAAGVANGQGAALTAAIGLLIVGRFRDALELFEKAPDNRFRNYYTAQCALALGRFDEAVQQLGRAASRGWDAFETDMLAAAIHLRQADDAAAQKLLDKHAAAGTDRAEWYYVAGLCAERRDEWDPALELFDKALTLSPEHSKTMFRAARLYDTRGDDDRAIDLYERLAAQPRTHVNALINLSVVYEDIGEFDEARECLLRVLKQDPNHTRARLFLKDVESSAEMVIDDKIEQRAETRNRLLDTPVGEFELSVRARNCLKKMRIQTLGELLGLNEPELLAYKNFGETSLNEIKALLAKKGLKLGLQPDEIDENILAEAVASRRAPLPGAETLLARPVSELELSVRARRCLQRLNIVTLSELVRRSENELLHSRNFGVTSLNEIKSRLAERGLRLATK